RQLLVVEQIGHEVSADGGVVRGLEDHVLRHLSLNGQSPVVTFGQAYGFTALPPRDGGRDAGPDAETGIGAGRLRDDILPVAHDAGVQFEDRGAAVVVRRKAEDDDSAVEPRAARRSTNDGEAARRPAAYDRS